MEDTTTFTGYLFGFAGCFNIMEDTTTFTGYLFGFAGCFNIMEDTTTFTGYLFGFAGCFNIMEDTTTFTGYLFGFAGCFNIMEDTTTFTGYLFGFAGCFNIMEDTTTFTGYLFGFAGCFNIMEDTTTFTGYLFGFAGCFNIMEDTTTFTGYLFGFAGCFNIMEDTTTFTGYLFGFAGCFNIMEDTELGLVEAKAAGKGIKEARLFWKWEEMMSSSGSCELDVWHHLDNLSGDVISRAAFGSSYKQGKKIFQLQKEQITIAMKVLHQVYIPGLRFLPTKTNKRMKEINNEMRVLMNNVISKRENQMKMGETCNDDLLGILLESSMKAVEEDGNKMNGGLSIDEVVEECKDFYLAGRDTTSCLLVWMMVMLGNHLDWQARARDEVLRVFGNNKPDFNGLNNLKVMTMIMYEVLRLYPPVILMYRMTHKPTKVGDILLPPGVQICVPTMLLHTDPELWGEDATKFNPQRFSQGIAKVTNGQVIYIPFSGGPRVCVGQNFALLEVKMAFAIILQRYSFQLSPSYSHAPFLLTSLQPQYGVPIILQKL
ncbi:hypothetical protein SOVF_067010 [Spinacia oleracea]|nr:hypothetical protein SOVF_067010 [Spinacia oleracea]